MGKFKVGDWVRSGRYATELEEEDLTRGTACFGGGQYVPLISCARVRVSDPKPRRTLTLSQGMTWLESVTRDVRTGVNGVRYVPAHVSCGVTVPGQWHVKRDDSSSVGIGPTVIKAIIAARRALKVKP